MVCSCSKCCYKQNKEETENIKLEKQSVRYYNTCISLHELSNEIVNKSNLS